MINLLLTDELKATMPESIKITMNFGEIRVIFPPEVKGEKALYMTGDNAVIDGSEEDLIKWLKPFDGVAVGVGGSPQFEKFEIRHIAKDL